MDKKKKPIDLSDWEDYHDPVSIATNIGEVLLIALPIHRKDLSNSTDQIAAYLRAKPWSIVLEVSETRETTSQKQQLGNSSRSIWWGFET
jgi:hypothetical protein